jgi:uncharacterized protein (TIGR02001 family)
MPAQPSAGPPEPVPARAPWRALFARRRLLDSPWTHGACALWFLFVSADVFAQFSGSASLLSDYRFRGVSLSHSRPAAQLAVAYDDASGWYAGAFASTVQLVYPTNRELQLVSFAGYAQRTPSGVSWEAGADYSVITGPESYSYPEVYVGLATESVSWRLYYAPRYFGQDSGVLYGEINAAQPLIDRVRFLAHGGVLRNNGESLYGVQLDRHVFDASVGVSVDFDQFSVQLSWVGISSVNAPYPATAPRRKNGALLILSRSF